MTAVVLLVLYRITSSSYYSYGETQKSHGFVTAAPGCFASNRSHAWVKLIL
jgi:hypothetical protein